MYVLSAEQIRAWDRYTIEHEPISSFNLMERAAEACFQWLEQRNWKQRPFVVYCGKGNNGGDGLSIARKLLGSGYTVSVYILENGRLGSEDFQKQLQHWHAVSSTVYFIQDKTQFPQLSRETVCIDALYGTGLNAPATGTVGELISHINAAAATVVSIDLPSGMFADLSSKDNSIIAADHTLSFEQYKLAFLLPENGPFLGSLHLLPIGLHPGYLNTIDPGFSILGKELARVLYKPRDPFAHKGSYGHALLIAGSYGKMGAATMAVKACVRTGAGLTTAFIPSCGYEIMQISVPEAMVITDNSGQYLSTLPADIEKYKVIGIGPGIGTEGATGNLLSFILKRFHHPLVIDADALNLLAADKELLTILPSNSILTPHPREFERLFGGSANDHQHIHLAIEKAKELSCVIILKGHHSLIATPGGKAYFNTSGNPALAKGGSGDVLTGMITALLAQGYDPVHAALLAVYLHGLAADKAVESIAPECLTAGELILYLSEAFRDVLKC